MTQAGTKDKRTVKASQSCLPVVQEAKGRPKDLSVKWRLIESS